MAFDCQKCGACCCHNPAVFLFPEEAKFFLGDPELSKLVYKDKELYWLKIEDGQCIALDGEIGGVSCSIYDVRPQLCRDFEVGCRECRIVRRIFKIGV